MGGAGVLPAAGQGPAQQEVRHGIFLGALDCRKSVSRSGGETFAPQSDATERDLRLLILGLDCEAPCGRGGQRRANGRVSCTGQRFPAGRRAASGGIR